jgi:hypothetical protein
MKTRSLLLALLAMTIAACGPQDQAATPNVTPRSSAPAAVLLPTWMSECLRAGGISFNSSAAPASHILQTQNAVTIARGYSNMLKTAPSSAVFAQFKINQQGTMVSQRLTHAVWAVGFGGLHAPMPGGLYPSGAGPSSQMYMIGRIIIVDDATKIPVLAFDCPS